MKTQRSKGSQVHSTKGDRKEHGKKVNFVNSIGEQQPILFDVNLDTAIGATSRHNY